MKINELISLLPADEHVYVTGHVHPDGDCIGAALGLYQLLVNNRNVRVILEERPESYSDLSGFSHIMTYDEFQSQKEAILKETYSLIVVDSGDLSRIEPIVDLFHNASTTVNIDHHDSNTYFADYNYVDTKSSSTSEMIGLMMGLLDGDRSYLTKAVSDCLYTGIIYDTGVFKHSNTRQETHLVAGHLVSMGIDFTDKINRMYFTRSPKNVKALQIAINNLTFENEGRIAMTVIGYEELIKESLSKQDTESVVSFLNEIEGPLASAFLLELKPGSFKGSFRAKDYMNVCNVAKVFGGGGHIKASGCTIEDSLDRVKTRVLKEMEVEFQRHH